MTPTIEKAEKELRKKVPPWETKWLEWGQELTKNSPGLLNDTAKTLVSLVSGVTAIYTGVLALLGIDKTVSFPWNLALLVPFLLFMLSIYYGIVVFNPRLLKFKPDDIEAIRNSYQDTSVYKYKVLLCSVCTFLLAMASIVFIVFVVPIIASLFIHPSVQFLVPPNNTADFINMGFAFDRDQITKAAELKSDSGTTYTVLVNGSKVVFSKDLVTGAFYS